MSVTDVSNRNFQSPLNFEFRVDRLTDFNFFVQKINIPGLTIGSANMGTPLVNLPMLGDHMNFGELSVEFKLDEGMRNWFEIFSWMQGIAFPERQEQYGALVKGQTKDLDGKMRTALTPRAAGDMYGQGVLTINSSANNGLVAITFVDLHPVSLSESVFDTTNTEVAYVSSTVGFKYDYYTVEKIR